jgi:dTDP-4-amino-4,6-dideoxygalactose transaminase
VPVGHALVLVRDIEHLRLGKIIADELQADRRDALKDFLKAQGIGTLIQWGGKAVHQWERLGFNVHLPKTEKFFERCIMLPMNVYLSDSEVHYVCDQVHAFYRG